MKVYISLPTDSRGIVRVHDALIKYAPQEIEFVDKPSQADLVLFHVIGRHDRVVGEALKTYDRGKRYAVIQYCLKSTMKPKTKDWLPFWSRANLVWSYYDLPEICRQEDSGFKNEMFNFYHAPLGVDCSVFKDKLNKEDRRFIIATCSQHALVESAKEALMAAEVLGMPMFHLGRDLSEDIAIPPNAQVTCRTGITDQELAHFYSDCEFVSGLRRVEGFEFPVIEGLMCGARPIVFDRPEMRFWFNELAVFIPEEPREQVVNSLVRIFEQGAKPVTDEEKVVAMKRFNWENIIGGFWTRILS